MIVTRTPLRVSFFGGGSDIPEFYNKTPGLVVSTAIDSYIYLMAHRGASSSIKVMYSMLEQVNNVEDVQHDRVRAVLKMFKINSNIEIASFSNIPTKGTGLGSSSTFTVGLINALDRVLYPDSEPMPPLVLADIACMIEIEKCGEPIGKQDQYAAAYGGFNVIRFDDIGVEVTKVPLERAEHEVLNSRLICFNSGFVRQASSVLQEQVNSLKSGINFDQTKLLVDMAEDSIKMLANNKLNDFGALLNDAWQVKKKLASKISNSHIDEMYEKAMKAGALGGKLLGAGGGGYLLMYVPDAARDRVLEAMKGYPIFNFNFDYTGSTVRMAE